MGFRFINFTNAEWSACSTVALNAAKNAGILAAKY